MFDCKLFRINQGQVFELVGTADTMEKPILTQFDKNLEVKIADATDADARGPLAIRGG